MSLLAVARQPLAWIVLLGAAVRLPTLGRWSVWIDETFTLHDAFHDVPLYALHYWVTRLTVMLAGDGEVALRIVPCLLGLATLWLVGSWRPARGQVPRAVPLLAALLLALSSWHVFWSQNARYYAPQAFFVVLAFAAATGMAKRTPVQRALLGGGAAGAALLCHPSSVFYVPALFAVALGALPRRVARPVAVAGAVAAVAGAALYAPLILEHIRTKGASSPWQVVASYGFLSGPLLLSAAALGAFRGRRGQPRPDPVLVLAAVPLAGIVAASPWLFATGYHAFATLPFVALLAARGCHALRPGWRGAAIALLVLEQLVGLVLYHVSHGMRPRYREAAALMRAEEAAGACLFATQTPPVAYYVSDDRRELRDSPDVAFLDDWLLDDLEAALQRGARVCVLVHPDDLHDWPPPERARLDALLRGLRVVELPGSFGPKQLGLRLAFTP